MDVVKLQKLNSMTGELKKHNFASSSDVAFQQAEQIFEPKSEVIVESKSEHRVDGSELVIRRFEVLLEQQRLKFEQEINLLRSALGILSNELDSLKSEIKKVEVPKVKEYQEPLKTEVKEPHPRQGIYKPGDVDIQKMFYCGR